MAIRAREHQMAEHDDIMSLAEVEDLWLTLNWEPESDIGEQFERLVNTAKLGAEDGPGRQAEIARLRRWVSDLQSGMYVNCVYCGHRYGPADQVETTMADALKQHIEQCPRHPMSGLKLLLRSCVHALRSYQYGNAAPGLAKSIADRAEAHVSGVEIEQLRRRTE